MENKNEIVIERIKSELSKIDKNENQIFFFVINTNGIPSGSLEYIYRLADFLVAEKYNVTMLYQKAENEEFVIPENYTHISHKCVSDGDIKVSPSDILFIPEIFANVMVQTKKLPCKRIAILQNYDYLIEQMPFSVQWGDLGIMECITNTQSNVEKIKEIFPYVKTTVIDPFISDVFGTTSEPKEMLINVIAKNPSDINKVVKPFYWKYPMYKWVSFRDLRGLSETDFAQALRTSEVTVWIDESTSFGYSALEAMKSGNIVLAKATETELPWVKDGDVYTDSCVWFSNYNELHRMLASVIRSVITNQVPEKIYKDAEKTVSKYKKETSKKEFLEYVSNVISERRSEIEKLIDEINTSEHDEDTETKN